MSQWFRALLVQEGVSFAGSGPLIAPVEIDSTGNGSVLPLVLKNITFNDEIDFFVGSSFSEINFVTGGVLQGSIAVDGNTKVMGLGNSSDPNSSVCLNTFKIQFYDLAAPVAQQTITGAKLALDVVMGNLLTALANLGLIVNATT